jgi:hypothetical protein
MKKVFFLVLIIFIFPFFYVYAQSGDDYIGTGYKGIPREAVKNLEEYRKSKLPGFWSKYSGDWLDGALLNVLSIFDGLFYFFMGTVKTIAMICFTLSLGIGIIKMMFGGIELNKLLTQTFMGFAIFSIMIWIFPSIMGGILSLTQAFASEAVLQQSMRKNFEEFGVKNHNFKKFVIFLNAPAHIPVGEQEARPAGVKPVEKEEIPLPNDHPLYQNAEKEADRFLALEFFNKKTMLVSANEIVKNSFLVFKGIWAGAFVKGFQTKILEGLASVFLCIFVSLMYIWTVSVAVINYWLIIIQFGFIYATGCIFIPLMLWDGSKHAFDKLTGSMYNITVHMFVKTIVLFLCMIINVEIMLTLWRYGFDDGKSLQQIIPRAEVFVSIIFLTVMMKLMVDQSTSIADMLCGGQPKLSFGEFAQAAASGAAAGMAGGAVVGSAAKTAASLGMGAVGGGVKTLAGGASAAHGASQAAFKAEHDAQIGMGKTEEQANAAAKISAGRAGRQAFGNSLRQGGANAFDSATSKIASGVKGLPGGVMGGLSQASQLMRYGMHPTASVSAEGIGIAPRNPYGRHGGGQGGGGSGGSGGSGGGSNGEEARGKKGLESNRQGDRNRGAVQTFRDLRESGDQKYQGASGLYRSIGEATKAWHDSNANAAGRYTGNNFGNVLSPEAQNYYKQQDTAAKAREAASNSPPATTKKGVERNHPSTYRKRKTN